jgi:hypothetical protein
MDFSETLVNLPAAVMGALPAAYRDRQRADALQVPMQYQGIVNQYVLHSLITYRFEGVVKTDEFNRLHMRMPRAGFMFVSASPNDTEFFHLDDPYLPGQPRYAWFPDPDDGGVKYGFLRYPDRK